MSASAWLPHRLSERQARPERRFAPAVPFVAFLDGSWANDSTGLVAEVLEVLLGEPAPVGP